MSEYTFVVPCFYSYRIVAESEEQAREILEQGGIDCPAGEPLLEPEDYKKADCVDVDFTEKEQK